MPDPDWRHLPPLTTLRAFEATARFQGYSAAARSLNVTPAAIAQQVRKLEKDLGVDLVRREGRGLVLTEDGQDLAKTLEDAFDQIAKGVRQLKRRDAKRGVRVSTTDYFVNVVVLPQLGAFWQRYPDLQVSFSPDGNTQAVDFDRYDIVVRGAEQGAVWEGCEAIPLFETEIVICAAPSLLQRGAKDLCDFPWIRDRGMGGGAFDTAIRRAGCDPDTLTYVDAGSSKFELDAALMGYGLHVSPEMSVRKDVQNGRLVVLDVSLDMEGVYYALVRKGPVSTHVQCLLDWLIEVSMPFSYPPGLGSSSPRVDRQSGTRV
jgi:LysR family glycine cleavage system transcriptional activator